MDKNTELIRLSEMGRFWRLAFEELTEAERVFRAIWELVGEVDNGGFEQYFFNSSGDTAFAVVAALLAIGAENTARIVSAANELFPDSTPPRDRDARQALLDAFGTEQMDTLEKLDAEFFRYPDDLSDLLHAYVARNAASIEGAGNPA